MKTKTKRRKTMAMTTTKKTKTKMKTTTSIRNCRAVSPVDASLWTLPLPSPERDLHSLERLSGLVHHSLQNITDNPCLTHPYQLSHLMVRFHSMEHHPIHLGIGK